MLLLLGFENVVFSQEKENFRVDTIQHCIIKVSNIALKFESFKKLDSLIKLDNDVTVIALFSGGDVSSELKYSLLYLKNNIWNYKNNNSKFLYDLKDVPLNLYIDKKNIDHKSFVAVCPINTFKSFYNEYFYIFVVNKIIVSSYFGNCSISDIKSIDKGIENDIDFLEKLDQYLTKKSILANNQKGQRP